MNWDEVTPKLTEKLDKKHVRPPSQYGPKGDYLEGWHVIAEANRIFGFGGWSYVVNVASCVSERPKLIGKAQKDGWAVTYTAHIRVTIGDVIREDFGAGHGYDLDCGLAHESAIKEAVTDALKRALRTFGNPFGLALYDKTRENVGDPDGDREKAADAIAAQVRADTDAMALVESLKECATLKELMTLWSDANADQHSKPLLLRADVLKAKDDAKARLAEPDPFK